MLPLNSILSFMILMRFCPTAIASPNPEGTLVDVNQTNSLLNSTNSAQGATSANTNTSSSVNETTVSNTSLSTNTTTGLIASTINQAAYTNATLDSTILVLVRDQTSGDMITMGLEGYGIPYQVVIIPKEGRELPPLNSSLTDGNYGGILVLGELAYEYDSGWDSALKAAQWKILYDYQTIFNVRMVRLDAFPSPQFGTSAIGGCCGAGSGIDHDWMWTNTSQFSQAGLKTGVNASIKTNGLWHYAASISDATIATEIASFLPSSDGQYPTKTTAAVINTFGRRQQMVFFISWALDWSASSTILQHAWIQWLTRGTFAGRRRVYFSTQIDDMLLGTNVYRPINASYRAVPADMDAHITWQQNLQSRMPAGSKYFMEMGHNGNGPLAASIGKGAACTPNNWVQWTDDVPLTTLEFQKPLGTGQSFWPPEFTNYTWNKACVTSDPLGNWFTNNASRTKFAHMSHTFTHLYFNNATYEDAVKEIQFNLAFFKQTGISSLSAFSNGLIPPAITGMHNGDVIRAWMENGIQYVVGDNTRPPLQNKENPHWPLISTVADNGYDGLVIIPRYSTAIYYNCDTVECNAQEWADTSKGASGKFEDLLTDSRYRNVRALFGLRHDPYMFHQANMRTQGVPTTTIGDQTRQHSLVMQWAETVVQEYYRLVNWPMISLKHDDVGKEYVNRMKRDKCGYKLIYKLSADLSKIVGTQLQATGNKCDASIPVTFNGNATTSEAGSYSEKIGKDPLTIWVNMTGKPVDFTLTTPLPM